MNNCYISVCGGIGNQLFQIVTAYSYAKQYNKQLKIDTSGWNASQGNEPNIYKDNILQNFEFENSSINVTKIIESDINQMKYIPLNYYENDVQIIGYYQCPKYFNDCFDEFKNKLVLPKVTTDHIIPDSIAFHIRLGDYRHYSHIFGNIIPYFIRRFEQFKNEDIHVYTDSPNDILSIFKDYDFKLINTKFDLNDLTMLTKYNRIVCSNSSFSWWGAMLSNAKEILVPDKWILTINDPDIYTDRMTKYEF